jgi:hypothetical protein
MVDLMKLCGYFGLMVGGPEEPDAKPVFTLVHAGRRTARRNGENCCANVLIARGVKGFQSIQYQ